MRNLMLLLLTVITALFLFNAGTDLARGETTVNIKVNGTTRYITPEPRLVGGRVMLPLRFIVEDPAVKGKASWNGTRKEVTITRGDTKISFVIGQNTALVNGQSTAMDVAPFIIDSRTFVSLRFFAEQMGAVVAWKDRTNTALVNFDKTNRLLGYYYYGTPDLLDNDALTDVAFRWLETDGSGSLFYEYWGDAAGEAKRQQALQRAKANGIKTHASVVLMGWDSAGKAQMHQLLSSEENRWNLIGNLRNHARAYGYDGINIDLEGVTAQDRENFVTFLQDLTRTMHQDNRTVSVAVPAKTAADIWDRGYDYVGIGKAVDLVIIMAYDYNFDRPGPSAPIDWFEQVVDYAASTIPAEKLAIGIGAYGYDWNIASYTKKAFDQRSMNNLIAAGKFYPRFDAKSFTPYNDYIDSNGNQHRVWFENATSLEEKKAVVLENQVWGMAFWQMKGAFEDFYSVIV